ncbi:MAG: cyclodeaminase/cyclohydrolase family protein [Oscillospiraceae bacterium]|jgi:formiminotetrahydrofolate cyclodeaminase|nr:cyclodeaminase/cyclohydrolase family protein [Oscillospiraceae bacterium]
MESIPSWSLETFADELNSKAPVPGGGSVAALVGSLGAALAGMVGALTTGKKKYAAYEEDIQRILRQAEDLQLELMDQIDRDANNFLPLSKCYGLPAGTEEEKAEKEKKMQAALKKAVTAPVDIIKLSFRALKLQEELVEKGSRLALSDVGCGALCLQSSMKMAWLNVIINLKSIHDEEFVRSIRQETEPLLQEGEVLASDIYAQVEDQLS